MDMTFTATIHGATARITVTAAAVAAWGPSKAGVHSRAQDEARAALKDRHPRPDQLWAVVIELLGKRTRTTVRRLA